MTHAPLRLRTATPEDVACLDALIPASVRALSRDVYSERQIESAITYVFGVDTQLVRDGTYFVVETDGGAIAGCGGWSFRQTLYGGDQMKTDADPRLDPHADAARIRAFFVHPEWARQGVGSRLMQACADAAYSAGFRRLELMATLPGVPLYKRWNFYGSAPVWVTLPDQTPVPFVPMTCDLATVPVRICTVDTAFNVTGRGLIVFTEPLWNGNWQLSVGESIEVRAADGTRREAYIKRWEWWMRAAPNTDPRHRPRGWVLGGITRDEISAGDELWTAPIAPAGA